MLINKYIDHTVLKADTTEKQIQQLCKEALEHQFYAICINGSYVPLAAQLLKDSDVKIAAVIGFPLGAMSTESKVFEAQQCIKDGATEIDMVINIGFLKDKKYDLIQQEITAIKKAIGSNLLKVIIETCLLSDDEKRKMCHIVIDAGAEYIKTSTGFNSNGATKEDLTLMLKEVQGKILVKAAGGVRDIQTAQDYINMGVMRLGTSSGVELVKNIAIDTNKY